MRVTSKNENLSMEGLKKFNVVFLCNINKKGVLPL